MPTKLRKVTKVLFKDSFGVGTAQIPALSVTDAVKVYKQGATVTTTGPQTIAGGGGTTIAVRDSGRLVVGDTVQKGSSSSNTATVSVVTSRTSITLVAASGTLSVSIGDRLVVTTNRPTLYSESSGSVSTGSSNVTTDASDGHATFYTTEPIVDIIYSGTGITTATEYDVEAGYLEPSPWIDIRAYGNDLVKAIAALPSTGGTIFMPANTYTMTATVTIDTAGVHLLGDIDGGTIIRASSSNNPARHMFQINRAGFRAEHIEFDGCSDTGAGAYDIMRWNGYGVAGYNVQSMYLSECYFHNAQRNCLRVTDTFECVVEKCLFNDNPDHGATTPAVLLQSSSGATDPVNDGVHAAQFAHFRFYECRFAGNAGYGLQVNTCSGVHVDSCRFEVNNGGVAANKAVGVVFQSSTQCSMHHCHSEGPYTSANGRASQWAYVGACRGITILNNSWVALTGDVGLQLKPSYACLVESSHGVFIAGNIIATMNTAGIVVAGDCTNVVHCASEDYGVATDADYNYAADTQFFGNGVTTVGRYATGSLPAYVAGRIEVGSLAYDTTTDNLKVLNNAHVWAKVSAQP